MKSEIPRTCSSIKLAKLLFRKSGEEFALLLEGSRVDEREWKAEREK